MSTLKAKTLQRLQELQGAPKRSLGQNFLVAEHVVERILQAVAAETGDLLEVGPGLGTLTDELIATGRPLRLIELDKKFAQYWRERGQNVIEADALAIDWRELNLPDPTILVSNLPYQIAASLVIERSLQPSGVRSMILMLQKEVGERVTASPSTAEYGLLSVVAQVFWRVDKLMDASPQNFYPPPRVASRVLRFRALGGAEWRDGGRRKSLLALVKAGFAQRRKLLYKNLGAYAPANWQELLTQVGAHAQARAEELSPDQFVKLLNLVEK